MKVKVDMRFRGRLITRVEVGKKIMNDFLEAMSEIAVVERKSLSWKEIRCQQCWHQRRNNKGG